MNKETELVDLVDADGAIQQEKVLRTEINSYPNLYLPIVIGVIFDSKDRILVHKRSEIKKINPGDIDHICGGIMSGETPEEALIRESLEETGIKPVNLKILTKGLNSYNRYRYLLMGESNTEPGETDPSEVEWVSFIHPDELNSKNISGEFTFVDEFFEDTGMALQGRTKKL